MRAHWLRAGIIISFLFGTHTFSQVINASLSGTVSDPACASLAPGLTQWCTLTALADANGNVVLRNAGPGQPGTLGLRAIEGPGNWDLHANIQKSIQIAESKRLTFRIDANNVLNHPTPGAPSLNINSGTFGQITTKTGSRSLQAQLHLDF